jgi:hypothetical protein
LNFCVARQRVLGQARRRAHLGIEIEDELCVTACSVERVPAGCQDAAEPRHGDREQATWMKVAAGANWRTLMLILIRRLLMMMLTSWFLNLAIRRWPRLAMARRLVGPRF